MSKRPAKQPKRPSAARLLAIFFSTSVPRQVSVVLCLLLASVADGLGLATLLPVIGLASGQTGDESKAQQAVAAVLEFLHLPATLGVLLAIVMLALIVKAGLMLLAMNHAGYAGAQVGTDLRLRLLNALLNVRWGYFTRQPVGTFANAINNEAQRVSAAYLEVANLITNVIQSLVLIGVSFLLSWRMSVLAIGLGVVIIVVLGRLVRAAKRAGREQTHHIRWLSARLTDTLSGIKPLKAMARHTSIGNLFVADVHTLHRNQRRQIFTRQANRLLQEPMIGVFLLGAFYYSNAVLGMPINEVLVMGLLLARILSSIGKAQQAYQAAMLSESAYASMRRTIDGAEAEHEVWPGTETPTLDRGIAFRNVSKAYGARPVLRDFSLTIPAGKVTALIGPSGAGKTTVVDLLLALHAADAGEIEIDGVPLERISVEQWRRKVGYVPQDVMLFHDSILNNLTLGSSEFGPEDARRALEAARAWEFVRQQPDGMESTVGERGTLVSGGQRQRIAIARALVHRPSLLILDEATSALDPETEAEICRNIQELSRETGLTVLAISHQRAWAEMADEVLRMEPLDFRPPRPAV
ncbi:ABC transporter protein [uncultured Alphaproteobacteria bacterium]|uniref:ABC transporter protein n=1 Tax=uncultured Alphaproteobacteria bacterium TaxID=91750 RepID=A0A212KI33_9PROT|nr:ABC transporter protein [uncultured Alphaproteobacteria bacterium]